MTIPVSINGSTLTALARLPFANGQAIRIDGYVPPAPLSVDTTYYIVSLAGLAFSVALIAGGTPIVLTDTGSGQISIYETPPLTWQQLKLLPLVQYSDVRRLLTTPESMLNETAAPNQSIGLTISGNVFTTGIEHGLVDWTPVRFAGTAPSPLVAGTTYYVRDTTPTTFTAALSIGGAVIVLGGAGSNVTVSNYMLDTALVEKIDLAGEWLFNALSERIIKHLSRVGWNWWTWFYPTQPIMPSPPRQTAGLVLDSLKNPEKLIHAWVDFTLWAMSIDGRWRNQIINPAFLTQFGQSPEQEREKRAMKSLDDICPLLEVTGDYGQRRIFDFEQVSDSIHTSLL